MNEDEIQRLIDEGRLYYPEWIGEVPKEDVEKAQKMWLESLIGQYSILNGLMLRVLEPIRVEAEKFVKDLNDIIERRRDK